MYNGMINIYAETSEMASLRKSVTGFVEPDVHSKDEKIEYDKMIAEAWKNSLSKS